MKFSQRLCVIIGLAVLFSSVMVETSEARYSGRSVRRGRSSRYHGGYNPYLRMLRASAAQQAALQRAAAQRAAAMSAAVAERTRAESALSAASRRLKTQFENSPDMIAATQAHEAAEADHERERQRVLRDLAATADYRDALARKKELHKQEQALLDSGGTVSAARKALLQEELEAGSKVTRLEAAALKNDSAYQRSLKKLQETAERVKGLKQRFSGSITKTSEWTQARQKLDQAQAQVAAANMAGFSSSPGRTARNNNRTTRSRGR